MRALRGRSFGNLRSRRARAWDCYWTGVRRDLGRAPGGFTRWAVGFLRSQRCRTVLDLGCGSGRDLRSLLGLGFTVTGVDCSAIAIARVDRLTRSVPAAQQRRLALFHADLIEFLASVPASSVDAVHAAATYQTLSEPEIPLLFEQVHRVLVPGGLHLWSVRSARHAGRRRAEPVPPNTPTHRHSVPSRFFARRDIARLSRGRFERVRLTGAEPAPGLRLYYVADLRP